MLWNSLFINNSTSLITTCRTFNMSAFKCFNICFNNTSSRLFNFFFEIFEEEDDDDDGSVVATVTCLLILFTNFFVRGNERETLSLSYILPISIVKLLLSLHEDEFFFNEYLSSVFILLCNIGKYNVKKDGGRETIKVDLSEVVFTMGSTLDILSEVSFDTLQLNLESIYLVLFYS